ncbi:copper resistance protein B [Rhizorhabdus sp.]|uniref:copper resistance protein B n=1 Tax=Rhizorhabdus sp. TaxID=1968843 RepID=UPI0019955AB6|nr:copper resistance protein B [Rhizorhabdus sp.]MBD3762303.1 copper resistance protein B [Rhizorhabdus sp.]
MSRTILLALGAMLAATPATAQMDHSAHGGHDGHEPAAAPAQMDHSAHGGHEPAAAPAQMDHSAYGAHGGHEPAAAPAPSADPHAGHHMHGASGTDPVPAGEAPPPAADWAADAIFPAARMKAVRESMIAEHGGASFSQIMFNIAEVAPRRGADRYRWDGEGWFGGDINRLVVKSEGEGGFGRKLETAEAQILYSRALDAYWNLQAGARQDFGEGPSRSYATIGVEGLAPYWFEVEGALFLSDKGRLFGRIEAYYDQRLTQRLVLQPRIEANLSAQRAPAERLGAGLTDIELGLRLRYEITREFAPYVGVSHERRVGRSARLARAAGDAPRSTAFIAGVRFWL